MRVVKLGGSVVSPRGVEDGFSEINVRRLGDQLRDRSDLILVHGVGALGRSIVPADVARDGIAPAAADTARMIRGRLHELRRRVEGVLRALDVPVTGIDPDELFTLEDGQVEGLDPTPLIRLLDENRLPLVHGSLVWDESGRFEILSSDRIVSSVAPRMNADLVVWVTDVDGVTGQSPDGPVTLRRLTPGERHRVLPGERDRTDPTGGMAAKLDAAFEVAGHGIPSIVVNGLVPGRLAAALDGRETCGTIVAEC